MAKLRIRSIHRPFTRSVADALRADGHEVVLDRSLGHHGTVRLHRGFDEKARHALLESIAAFELDVEEDDTLDDEHDRDEARSLLDRFDVRSVKFARSGRPLRSGTH